MAKVHREFTWEGNIGKLDAALRGLETEMIVIRCPEGICTPMEYHFAIEPGQTMNEALSKQVLPSCMHGPFVLPDDLVS